MDAYIVIILLLLSLLWRAEMSRHERACWQQDQDEALMEEFEALLKGDRRENIG